MTGSEDISYAYDSNNNRKEMTVGNKVTAYKYNKNDELLRTDTLNTETEEDSVVIYENDKNGNQLATVNRYEIPNDKKDSTYVDIDVTLGDNRLNENVVNHYNALDQLTQTLTKNYKVSFTYDAEGLRTSKTVNGNPINYTDPTGHKAGKWFSTLNKAAIDFGKTTNRKFIKNLTEYNTYFYKKKGKKKYSYTVHLQEGIMIQ